AAAVPAPSAPYASSVPYAPSAPPASPEPREPRESRSGRAPVDGVTLFAPGEVAGRPAERDHLDEDVPAPRRRETENPYPSRRVLRPSKKANTKLGVALGAVAEVV